jgi:ribose/xylose/arabinose/galactoside ABC-type transport system permease subunit
MKKIFGILGLLIVVSVITAMADPAAFLGDANIQNLMRRTALFGIISIGVAFVIITAGIDLSIGSVVCLVGCGLPYMVMEMNWPLWVALAIVLLVSLGIGMFHGTLITKLRLQPFVVTLCGLLFYRGITRGFTNDQPMGFKDQFQELRPLGTALFPIDQVALWLAYAFAVVLVIAVIAFRRHLTKLRLGGLVVGVVLCAIGSKALHLPNPEITEFANQRGDTYITIKLNPRVSNIAYQTQGEDGEWTAPATKKIKKKDVRNGSYKLMLFKEWKQEDVRIASVPLSVPAPCFILAAVAILSAIFLNCTIYGRYLFALGRNEQAAKFSGINTDRMILVAYVICALLSGLGGMLFVLDINNANPSSFGNFFELYAIAAAVLGGCSLRGGEGSILGVVIGTALMQVLRNMINLVEAIPKNIEFAVIGAVILIGVSADEVVRRIAAKRKADKQVEAAKSS